MATSIQSQSLRTAEQSFTNQLSEFSRNTGQRRESTVFNNGGHLPAVELDHIEVSQSAVEALRLLENIDTNPGQAGDARLLGWMSDDELASMPTERSRWMQSQVVRLRDLLSDSEQFTSMQTDMRAFSFETQRTGESTNWDLGESGDKMIREYLALIRTLTEDEDSLNAFLGMFERFLSRGKISSGDLTEFFDSVGESFGFNQVAQGMNFFSSLQIHFEIEIETTTGGDVITEEELQQIMASVADPLVLDLDGDGIELTSARNGVDFDITGDGKTEKTAFVTGDDAFLAIDKNGNGQIDNGRELFGDQNGAANGFEELAEYDSNQDGQIDQRDAVYDNLSLFTDRNRNGKTDEGELRTLREAGIAGISLSYNNTNHLTSGGNRVSQVALFTRFDGRQGTAADALLNYVA
ncbi:MAG: hypothetical protein ABIH23_36145 [bacterium]